MGHLNETMKYYLKEWSEQDQILFYPNSKDLLLRIGAKIFVGIDDVGQDYQAVNNAFMAIADGFTDQLKKEIPGTPFYRGKKGMRTLHSFFAELVPQRRGGSAEDMLSHMCRERQQNGELFSDEDIVLHATFLLFGAHDTTTSVLNLLMMYLAQDQSYQQTLRELCQSLPDDDLSYTSLERLAEIEYASNECLRLHPTIPMQIRRTIRECEFGGYRIPPNTTLMVTSMYAHYDERYWSNPQQFDPARFSPERAEHKSHSFAFFPFGGGAHKCIGMHFANILVKTFVYQLLCNYKIRLPDGFTPKLDWVPLPKPAKLPLILEPLQ
jgi:cytochrome P450